MPTGSPSSIPETRPNPDPTIFSKELVDKEILHLREYIEARMEGRDRLTDERLSSAHQAIQRVEQVANAERGTQNTLINGLKERMDRGDGRMGGQATIIATAIAIAGIIIGVLVYLKP